MEQPHQLKKKKTNRNCAKHGVVLFILLERVTSAIVTSARITSACFRAYNIVHCYCSGTTIYYIIDCTCVYQVSLLVNWRKVNYIIREPRSGRKLGARVINIALAEFKVAAHGS